MPLFRPVPFFPQAKARWAPSRKAGTITTLPFKNNTGTVLASLALTAYIYEVITGALVVIKTGSTDASGIFTCSDALLTPSTSFRCVVVMTVSGAEGMATYTAS